MASSQGGDPFRNLRQRMEKAAEVNERKVWESAYNKALSDGQKPEDAENTANEAVSKHMVEATKAKYGDAYDHPELPADIAGDKKLRSVYTSVYRVALQHGASMSEAQEKAHANALTVKQAKSKRKRSTLPPVPNRKGPVVNNKRTQKDLDTLREFAGSSDTASQDPEVQEIVRALEVAQPRDWTYGSSGSGKRSETAGNASGAGSTSGGTAHDDEPIDATFTEEETPAGKSTFEGKSKRIPTEEEQNWAHYKKTYNSTYYGNLARKHANQNLNPPPPPPTPYDRFKGRAALAGIKWRDKLANAPTPGGIWALVMLQLLLVLFLLPVNGSPRIVWLWLVMTRRATLAGTDVNGQTASGGQSAAATETAAVAKIINTQQPPWEQAGTDIGKTIHNDIASMAAAGIKDFQNIPSQHVANDPLQQLTPQALSNDIYQSLKRYLP